AEDLGADRGGDEHQADQRRRCGADQQVEIMPAVKQLAQFRVHSCHPFDAAARDNGPDARIQSAATLRRSIRRCNLRLLGGTEEGKMRICKAVAGAMVAFALSSAAAWAQALKVVNVNAPAVNCVFSTNCTIVVNDSIGYVPLPYLQAPKTAWLQSRTYTAM